MHADATDAATVEVVESQRGSRLLVRWWADEPDVFAVVLASFRSTFATHGSAQWLSEQRCWSLPLCERGRLEQWLAHTFAPHAITWTLRTSTGSHQRSSYGDDAAEVLRSLNADLERAFSLLCLTPNAPPDLVTAAYRWWSRQMHPDTGGSDDAMKAVNAAAALIREHQAVTSTRQKARSSSSTR